MHRDIKADNVLVKNNKDGSYTLYLSDFGLSRRFDIAANDNLNGSICGVL
jgi:serine/threonine protein kinase